MDSENYLISHRKDAIHFVEDSGIISAWVRNIILIMNYVPEAIQRYPFFSVTFDDIKQERI